jgi:hypothetical protein
MGLEVKLLDGYGTGAVARVNDEGTLEVVVHQHPPLVEPVQTVPLVQHLTDDGTASGTTSMKVVGTAAAPIPYWVGAAQDRDRFIQRISVEITGAGATLNEFGNLSALTNGVNIVWETQDLGNVTIGDDLKTNYDFVRLSGGNPAFGDGASAFRAGNVSGTAEGYIPIVDFGDIFGLNWGFRLRKGTNDRIVFYIRDDLTGAGLASFNAVAYGLGL